ncbi:MAG: L,D-transpeptidase family protein [Lachnospiraceae bacterium]|nr:L,D-transpeptidase family protein [Lachnospiraceae bacterium]
MKKAFEKWKAKKGFKKWIIPVDIALLLIAAAGYFVITSQYTNRFIPGTRINGVDVSNLYEDEAQKAVASTLNGYALNLKFADGTKEAVKGSEVSVAMLPSAEIPELLHSQNRFAWFTNVFGTVHESTIETSVSYDRGLLQTKIISLPEMQKSVQFSPHDACLSFDEKRRLVIIPEEEGNEIDTEKLLEAAGNAIQTVESELVLTDVDGIYQYPKRYADDKELTECMESVNRLLDTKITVTMSDGSKKVLDDTVLLPYLALGTDGLYTITDEMIEQCAADFVNEMAAEDDCYGPFRNFQSTRLGIIHMDAKEDHGHTIDREQMKTLIADDLRNCFSANHLLAYTEYIDHTDPMLGGTYVEIDIYGQHVYFYKDGKLDFDTPCVTGTEGTSRATPSGIYDVFAKYYDTVLRGPLREDGTPSYESHVDYFLAFYHGYGMHDATWRSKSQFGTDRYTYDGSHGCVNLPYDSARYLYKNVDKGTPVVVFRAKISAAEEEAARAEAEAAFAEDEKTEDGEEGKSESDEDGDADTDEEDD